jgi:hypothetical protein
MGRAREQVLPIARKEGIVVKELADEFLIYDLHIHKAHVLNETAALVWKHCDGRTSIAKLAAQVEVAGIGKLDEESIWLALEQLGKAKLLEKRIEKPASLKRMTRREVIRKVGVAAAVPLVVSLVAPNASAALSCAGRLCAGNPGACGTGCNCDGSVCV